MTKHVSTTRQRLASGTIDCKIVITSDELSATDFDRMIAPVPGLINLAITDGLLTASEELCGCSCYMADASDELSATDDVSAANVATQRLDYSTPTTRVTITLRVLINDPKVLAGAVLGSLGDVVGTLQLLPSVIDGHNAETRRNAEREAFIEQQMSDVGQNPSGLLSFLMEASEQLLGGLNLSIIGHPAAETAGFGG